MRILSSSLAAFLALAAPLALAADASVITIADGSARVLRGTVWYKLVPGATFQEGDVIDAGERTTVQVELASGGTLNLVGPGALYAATLPQTPGKDPIEFGLERGWLKFAAAAPGGGARVRTPAAAVTVNDAILIVHQENRLFELFVESGAARLAETARAGRDGPPNEAKAGEYWTRDADKPFTSERRAPVKFVASMPRHQIDKLASLAGKVKGKKVALTVDREITLAEADPWLAGPYRRVFARRLGGRLADPAFRKAVESNIAAYPDFDRVLHPEKFAAGGTVTTSPPGAPTAGASTAGAAPAAVPPAPPVLTPPATSKAAAPAPAPATAPAAKANAPAPPATVPPNPPPKTNNKTGALGRSPVLSLIAPEAREALL